MRCLGTSADDLVPFLQLGGVSMTQAMTSDSRTAPLYLLKPPLLTIVLFREDDRHLAQCIELDLITDMDNAESALKAIVEMIQEYAQDYREREGSFARSPNRAHHKPYVTEVLHCQKEQELLERLVIRYGSLHVQPISQSVAKVRI